MATRARIGRLNADGSVTSIYSHWDGYPDGAGATLAAHYTDAAKLDALLTEGDVSSLGAELGERHDFDTHSGRYENGVLIPDPRAKEWCLFYRRDRGESDVDAVTHAADEWPDSGQEYEYLFSADGWKVREIPYGASPSRWRSLAQEVTQS